MRDKVCCMFGMGQPSNPLVVALSLTKSRVSLKSRFLDDPKLEQCLNLGAYRVLFFSRVITL